MTFKVYPYKQGSKSARTLADTIGGRVLKKIGSKYRPKKGDVVINWGASDLPDFGPAVVLNKDVTTAQCKLDTLVCLDAADVRVPDFWLGKNDFLKDQEYPVVCRTKLRGHSGDGIVIANNEEELVDAPLYTKYVKKKDEYRVHVVKGTEDYDCFFIQRKARKMEVDNPDWKVRNLAGGFVFVSVEEFEVPKDVLNQAVAALDALGLDFGGVDVIWNDNEKKAYVLEVNTAVGLEQRTADGYTEAFHNLFEA